MAVPIIPGSSCPSSNPSSSGAMKPGVPLCKGQTAQRTELSMKGRAVIAFMWREDVMGVAGFVTMLLHSPRWLRVEHLISLTLLKDEG